MYEKFQKFPILAWTLVAILSGSEVGSPWTLSTLTVSRSFETCVIDQCCDGLSFINNINMSFVLRRLNWLMNIRTYFIDEKFNIIICNKWEKKKVPFRLTRPTYTLTYWMYNIFKGFSPILPISYYVTSAKYKMAKLILEQGP